MAITAGGPNARWCATPAAADRSFQVLPGAGREAPQTRGLAPPQRARTTNSRLAFRGMSTNALAMPCNGSLDASPARTLITSLPLVVAGAARRLTCGASSAPNRHAAYATPERGKESPPNRGGGCRRRKEPRGRGLLGNKGELGSGDDGQEGWDSCLVFRPRRGSALVRLTADISRLCAVGAVLATAHLQHGLRQHAAACTSDMRRRSEDVLAESQELRRRSRGVNDNFNNDDNDDHVDGRMDGWMHGDVDLRARRANAGGAPAPRCRS